MHFKKAHYDWETGDWNRLIDEINKAESPIYEMGPAVTPLKWYLGTAYFKLGNVNEAYNAFNEAYQINPYHVHILNDIGSCEEVRGNHAAAIIKYREALNLNPVFEEALLNLCAVYFNTGQYDSAYVQLTRTSPKSANPKIQTFAIAVVKAKINSMLKEPIPESAKAYLEKTKASPAMVLNVFAEARSHNTGLEEEIKKEARDSTGASF